MNQETLIELLNSAENELENYYTSGSQYDIEATERYCADLERQLVSLSD
jgi:hypothetical protein